MAKAIANSLCFGLFDGREPGGLCARCDRSRHVRVPLRRLRARNAPRARPREVVDRDRDGAPGSSGPAPLPARNPRCAWIVQPPRLRDAQPIPTGIWRFSGPACISSGTRWSEVPQVRMFERLTTYLSFVRFSHSVFALPFALTGALLASRQHPVTWRHVLWIVVCMVTARSAAMGFNRLVDARFDAANPRTSSREIPSRPHVDDRSDGLRRRDVGGVRCRVRAAQLLCFVLSPVALIVDFLVLAREAVYVGDAVVSRACHGGRAGRWMAGCRRWRWVGALAARPRDRAVGRAGSTCSTRARISTSIDAST